VDTGREGIQIVGSGHAVPFSKGLLGQSLTATGLSPFRAHHVALAVEERLLEAGILEVTRDQLNSHVETALGEMEGARYVERYHKWHSLEMEDRPVIILIGGTTGVGKSTLATTLAHRLGIVRIISTDAIRQVMRAFFSSTFMPAIHYSSFDAHAAVRIPVGRGLDPHVVGFVEQVEAVNVGVSAIIQRAVTEGTGMVLEGVHLVPGFTPLVGWENALILPMLVVVRHKELHRAHFLVRDRETDGRRPYQRYLDNFEEIRKIQDFILARADQEGTLIIDNLNIDDSVGLVVDELYKLIGSEQVHACEGLEGKDTEHGFRPRETSQGVQRPISVRRERE
jgi:2-phosphoglycerate kinase